MKTNKIFLAFIFVLANLLTYSQLKVLSNGNVGIGTSQPTSPLSIGTNHGVLLSIGNSSWDSKSVIETSWASSSGDFTEIKVPGVAINNAFVRLLQNGNFGIGNISPIGSLEITKLNSDVVFDLNTNGLCKMISRGWNANVDIHTFQINGTENINQLYLNTGGYVGIGTASPQFKLDVNGDIATYGTLRIASDERVKENIKPLINCLANISMINGKSYDKKITEKKLTRIKGIGPDTLRYHETIETTIQPEYGVLAQEIQKVFPELVKADNSGMLSVNYIGLIPVLIEALKEQQNQIEELKDYVNKSSSTKSASIATGTINNSTENKALLDQNIPNPFSNETKIGCFIPENASSSVLYIYNMIGTQLQQYSINGKGQQTVNINGNSFQPGMYLYALVIDGKEVDTKRMILTK